MMNTQFFSKLQIGDSQGRRGFFGRFSAVILLTMGLLLIFAEATPVSANNHENNMQGVNAKVASSWWKYGYTYNPSRVEDRMVSGDFDGDGLDDIATFYSYDNGGARIHTFLSSGESFDYSGSPGWWRTSSGYTLDFVANRMVAGDFNGDDLDDIASFYGTSSGAAYLGVFLSTGSSFSYQGSWWSLPSDFQLGNVGNRMVAGDFDNDDDDDIAIFYSDGGGGAYLNTFISTRSRFSFDSIWWDTPSGYTLGLVGDRMVAGDFDGDGYADDIATFYGTSSGAAYLGTFLSNGSSFDYGGSWWSTSSGFRLGLVDNRMVAGDFNNDGLDDVATLYGDSSGSAYLYTFLSTGSGFDHLEDWWGTSSGYTLGLVGNRMVAGNFSYDGADEIATMYIPSNGNAQIDVFIASSQDKNNYQGCVFWEYDCYIRPGIYCESGENCLSSSNNYGLSFWKYGRHCGEKLESPGKPPIDIIDLACQAHDQQQWKTGVTNDTEDCANDVGFLATVKSIIASKEQYISQGVLDPVFGPLAAEEIVLAFKIKIDDKGCSDFKYKNIKFNFFSDYIWHFIKR